MRQYNRRIRRCPQSCHDVSKTSVASCCGMFAIDSNRLSLPIVEHYCQKSSANIGALQLHLTCHSLLNTHHKLDKEYIQQSSILRTGIWFNILGLLIYYENAWCVAWSWSGRPEEFHLQSPTEPYVNLSIHTAPVSHSLETSQFQADAERN